MVDWKKLEASPRKISLSFLFSMTNQNNNHNKDDDECRSLNFKLIFLDISPGKAIEIWAVFFPCS